MKRIRKFLDLMKVKYQKYDAHYWVMKEGNLLELWIGSKFYRIYFHKSGKKRSYSLYAGISNDYFDKYLLELQGIRYYSEVIEILERYM